MSKRWNKDHATTYFGQNLRTVVTPSTPNDLINTDGGQFVFSMWTAKINGSYELPWQIRVTPALRFQSGQPFGRTVNATAAYGIGGAGGINYGSARILREEIGTRTQDDIVIFDFRAEKYFGILGTPAARRVLRRLQPDQQRRVSEHHLEQRIDVRAAQPDRAADHCPVRHEVRLVAAHG